MNQPDNISDLRNDALRKIGRNVVNFQKVEACLKYLVAVSKVHGTPDGLAKSHKSRIAQTNKLPFGRLSEAFFECVYGPVSEFTPIDASKIDVAMTFRIEADAVTIKKQKQTLSALVKERNRLIHKDLSGFDYNSASSCRGLIEALDLQNTRILRQLDELKESIDAVKEHLAALEAWANGSGPEQVSLRGPNDA